MVAVLTKSKNRKLSAIDMRGLFGANYKSLVYYNLDSGRCYLPAGISPDFSATCAGCAAAAQKAIRSDAMYRGYELVALTAMPVSSKDCLGETGYHLLPDGVCAAHDVMGAVGCTLVLRKTDTQTFVTLNSVGRMLRENRACSVAPSRVLSAFLAFAATFAIDDSLRRILAPNAQLTR